MKTCRLPTFATVRTAALGLALTPGLAAQLDADFSVSAHSGSSPFRVDFWNQSTGATTTSWSWDFGDGATSITQNIAHVYRVAAPTRFTVTFTAHAEGESDSETKVEWITVLPGLFEQAVEVGGSFSLGAVLPADVDGDGDRDLLGLGADAGVTGLAWLENLSSPAGPGPFHMTSASDALSRVVSADLDGDGDLDAASAGVVSSALTVRVHGNDGSGDFVTTGSVSSVATHLYDLDVADWDADGDPDVISTSSSFSDVLLWTNDGLGSLSAPSTLIDAGEHNATLHPVDLDGDGDLDLAVAAGNAEVVGWYENTDGRGGLGPRQVILAQRAELIEPRDLDGDGDLDLVTTSPVSQQLAWLEHLDGAGSFGPPQVLGPHAHHVALADVDMDGHLDLAVARFEAIGYDFTILRNPDGDGSFHTPEAIALDDPANRFVLEDLDGDGDLDAYSQGKRWYANRRIGGDWTPVLDSELLGGDEPLLAGHGPLEPGGTVELWLVRGPPAGSAALVAGVSAAQLPFKGGVLVPAPDVVIVGLPLDALGRLTVTDTWPAGIPAGVPVWIQGWMADGAGPAGFAASNAVSSVTLD